jgi:hypothetical protein
MKKVDFSTSINQQIKFLLFVGKTKDLYIRAGRRLAGRLCRSPHAQGGHISGFPPHYIRPFSGIPTLLIGDPGQ